MNKIKSIISYAVFFLGLVFVACQDVDPYGEGVANSLQLSVGQSDVSFDMERSSSVSVNASDNFGWSASTSATWVRLSPSSGVGVGNINIGVEDNPSTEKRNAIVTLKSSRYNKTASFNVEQAGTYLRIDTTSIGYFPLSGGKRSVPVVSNAAWEISSCPSWITTSTKSGNAGNTSFDMEVKENKDLSRDGVIVIKNAALSYRINVIQSGVQLDLGKQTMSFTNAKGSDTFTIKSNSSWTVTSDKPSWCTVDQSSGSGNATIKVSVTANTTESSRDAIITVKAGNVSRQVKVTQAALQLKLSKETLSFTPNSGNNTFTITSNVSWTVTSNKTSWCTVDKSSGSNNATIKVSVTDNTSVSSRDAIITVKSGDVSKQVKVTQDGVTLTVSESSLSFTSSAGNKTFTITSNYASWTVSSNQTSWCTVDKSSGSTTSSTIKVTVTANTSSNSRSATITVKSGNASKAVSVSQAGKATFTATMNTTNYKAEGDYWGLNVTASSSVSWTISRPTSDTWVHLGSSSNTSTKYNGTGTASVWIYVDKNSTSSKRYSTLTVSASGYTSITISISQEAGQSAFQVTKVEVRNEDYYGNVISDYGYNIYSSQARFLKCRITLKVNVGGYYGGSNGITATLYSPNDIYEQSWYWGDSSTWFSTGSKTLATGGYGSNTPGVWPSGQYRYVIKYKGQEIYTHNFRIY